MDFHARHGLWESTDVRVCAPPPGEVAAGIALYLIHLQLRQKGGRLSAAALDKARHYLQSFGKREGHKAAADVRADDLESWLAAHEGWQSAHTLADAVGTVCSCFKWLERQERRQPRAEQRWQGCPLTTRPDGLPRPEPRAAMLPAEYRALMIAARGARGGRGRRLPTAGPFRLALWWLWRTGARTCEMREARWTDLSWQTGVLELFEHKTARKTGASRLIVLDRWTLYLLRKVQAARGTSVSPPQHIFLNSRGRAWTKDFAKSFATYRALAGVREEVSAYSARHGVTVDLIEHGASDRQIADVLGHASTKYVAWYGRSTRRRVEHLQRVMELRRKRLE